MGKKRPDELVLTNLDKVFWEEEGYTKGDVIAYYDSVADTILPYLKDRPMVLNRHPNGIADASFFQKQVRLDQAPSFIKTTSVKHSKKNIDYLLVQDKATLIYVANLACIELNPLHSRAGSLDFPDYAVFDLDPENVPFEQVIEVALSLHALLEKLAVPNFCKTSGGRGLHIYVPLAAKYTYAQSKSFVQLIAYLILEKMPDLVSLERNPKGRQGQVYIDVPRNTRGQTLAAAYCLRPKPHAPVSMPLRWTEVKADLEILDFNIKTVPKRISKRADPFIGVLAKPADLRKILARLPPIL